MPVRGRLFPVLVGLVLAGACLPTQASSWKMATSLDSSALASDNVALVRDQRAQSDLVFQVTPSVTVRRETGGSQLMMSYQLQALKFADATENDRFEHRARFSGSLEVIPDRLFVDADLLIGKAGRLRRLYRSEASLIKDDENTVNLAYFRLEPELFTPVGDRMAQALRYRLTQRSALDSADGVEDTTQHRLLWTLSNKPERSVWEWEVRLNENFTERPGPDDTWLTSVAAASRRYLSENFALLGRVGYERNYLGDRPLGENGSYWSAGAAWLPLSWMELGAFLGPDDEQLQLSIFPNRRNVLQLNYVNQGRGLSTRDRWSASASHIGRRFRFRMGYEEDVTIQVAAQPQLLLPGSFDQNDPQVIDIPGLSGFGLGLTTISGEYLRQNWRADLLWQRRRDQLGLFYVHQKLLPITDDSDITIDQLELRYTRRHSRRASSELFVEWSGLDIQLTEESSDLYRLGYRWSRRLSSRFSWGVQYTHSWLQGVNVDEYRENRVSAYIRGEFGERELNTRYDLPRAHVERPSMERVQQGIPFGNGQGGANARFSRRSRSGGSGQGIRSEYTGNANG